MPVKKIKRTADGTMDKRSKEYKEMIRKRTEKAKKTKAKNKTLIGKIKKALK